MENPRLRLGVTLLLAPLVAVSLVQASGPQSATGRATNQAQDPMNARGAQAMGFDQEQTTHHFLLYEDGGAIDISVNDAGDQANRDAIRSHVPHIAMLFGQGQFNLPHFIHATDVPGTAELARLRDKISYRASETPAGARLDIVTTDGEALAALHAFLRFQIADHKTGDTGEVRKRGGL